MVKQKSRKNRQRGGQYLGMPLKYTEPNYTVPSASAGPELQRILSTTTLRGALNAMPVMSGGTQSLSPMTFQDAYHSNPMAPTGQALTGLTMPPTLRQGLQLQKMEGGSKTRRNWKRGGFYPSIMGGVVANAPLLAPVAIRQGVNLFSQYRKAATRRNRKQTRKSHRRRNSGRRA
jgi:hypothetical protein